MSRNKTFHRGDASRDGDIVAVIDAGTSTGVERVGIVTEAMRRETVQ